MKKIIGILLSVLLVITLGGCGSGQKKAEDESSKQKTDGKIEIVYWNQWTQEKETEFLKKYVDEYNKSQNRYHVKFLTIPFEEYTTTKLSTAFATNEAPDIFECSPAIINQYLDAGVCEPLDDILPDDVRSDFTDSAFDIMTRNGKTYGIPIDADIVGLYYNKEMLKKAGVEPPKTWKELMDAAVALESPDHSGFTFEVDKGDWQCFTFYPFVWTQGGNLFKDGKANLNSPEVINALQLWKELLNSGGCNETPGRSVSDISILTNGETAMQVNGSWSVLRTDPEKYGVVPLPVKDEGQKNSSVMGGWKVLVSNQSSKEKIEGAKDFIKWLWLDPKKCAEFDTEAKFSYSPRKSVIKEGADAYQENDNAIVFSDDILPVAQSEIALSGEAKEIMSNMIQDALYNMDAKAAAEKAQKAMMDYQDKNDVKFYG